MRWILDDTPFGHLALVRPSLVTGWEPGYLLVAETTARSMLNGRRDAVAALLIPTHRPAPVGRFEIARGTASWDTFVEIHVDLEEDADMAEHESISWAQSEGLDSVFVSADRAAILIALAELGRGRVASAFDLWIDLHEKGWLTDVEFERACDLTYNHVRGGGLPRKPRRVTEKLGSISAAEQQTKTQT